MMFIRYKAVFNWFCTVHDESFDMSLWLNVFIEL
jgi:hypothetical protein